MNIPINKDFERDYKESMWKGFSLHELLCIGAGTGIAVCAALLLWLFIKVPVTLAIYIAIFLGFPVIMSGFWKSVNGLWIIDYRRAVKYRKATATLLYRAREYQPVEPAENRKDGKKQRRMRSRKHAYRRYVKKQRRVERKESRYGAE